MNGTYKYDFSIDSSQVYGGVSGHVQLSPDRWGMPAGDTNSDGEINLYDKLMWRTVAGANDYLNADINLDGQVENKDINEFWINNLTIGCQVPD